MLDIGWPEFAIILIVALLVIGPRDLPKALYTVGKWVRAARRVAAEFHRHVDDMVRDAELDDVRKGIQNARQLNVKKQIENTIDPDHTLGDVLRMRDGKPSQRPAGEAQTASDESAAPAFRSDAPQDRPTSPESAPLQTEDGERSAASGSSDRG